MVEEGRAHISVNLAAHVLNTITKREKSCSPMGVTVWRGPKSRRENERRALHRLPLGDTSDVSNVHATQAGSARAGPGGVTAVVAVGPDAVAAQKSRHSLHRAIMPCTGGRQHPPPSLQLSSSSSSSSSSSPQQSSSSSLPPLHTHAVAATGVTAAAVTPPPPLPPPHA